MESEYQLINAMMGILNQVMAVLKIVLFNKDSSANTHLNSKVTDV